MAVYSAQLVVEFFHWQEPSWLRSSIVSSLVLSSCFRREFPDYLLSNRIIEISSSFVTASGSAGGFEVALNLIENQLVPMYQRRSHAGSNIL